MKIKKIGKIGKIGKRGVAGESILTVYRLILISFIALIILGLAAVFYDYYIDVRDVEARILAREVVNCVAPDGNLDLNKFNGNENKILELCGFDKEELSKFYVAVDVIDSGGKEAKKLEQGDSGLLWIKDIFENKDKTEAIAKYEVGYFPKKQENNEFNVVIDKQIGKIKVEVLVSHEF